MKLAGQGRLGPPVAHMHSFDDLTPSGRMMYSRPATRTSSAEVGAPASRPKTRPSAIRPGDDAERTAANDIHGVSSSAPSASPAADAECTMRRRLCTEQTCQRRRPIAAREVGQSSTATESFAEAQRERCRTSGGACESGVEVGVRRRCRGVLARARSQTRCGGAQLQSRQPAPPP